MKDAAEVADVPVDTVARPTVSSGGRLPVGETSIINSENSLVMAKVMEV